MELDRDGFWGRLWDDVKEDMNTLGLSQKDAQIWNKWRKKVKGHLDNSRYKGVCVCVCVCVCMCVCMRALTRLSVPGLA